VLDLDAAVDVLVEPGHGRDLQPEAAALADRRGQQVRGSRRVAHDHVADVVLADDRLHVARGPEDREVGVVTALHRDELLVDEADRPEPQIRLVGQAPGDLAADGVGAHDERRQLAVPGALAAAGDGGDADPADREQDGRPGPQLHALQRRPVDRADRHAGADDEDRAGRRRRHDPREVLERVDAQPVVVEAADLEVDEGEDDEEHRPRQAGARYVAVVEAGGADAHRQHPDVDEEAPADPRAQGDRADARAQGKLGQALGGLARAVARRQDPDRSSPVRSGSSLRLVLRRRQALTRACVVAHVAHRRRP
jgi:hypothetical protein